MMATQNATYTVNQGTQEGSFGQSPLAGIGKSMVHRLPVPTGIRNWLRTKAFQAVLRRAYLDFAERHPKWVSSLFDEHFLNHSAMPLLEDYLRHGEPPSALQLAIAWDEQLGPVSTAVRVRRIADFTPVAADFLRCLVAES